MPGGCEFALPRVRSSRGSLAAHERTVDVEAYQTICVDISARHRTTNSLPDRRASLAWRENRCRRCFGLRQAVLLADGDITHYCLTKSEAASQLSLKMNVSSSGIPSFFDGTQFRRI